MSHFAARVGLTGPASASLYSAAISAIQGRGRRCVGVQSGKGQMSGEGVKMEADDWEADGETSDDVGSWRTRSIELWISDRLALRLHQVSLIGSSRWREL